MNKYLLLLLMCFGISGCEKTPKAEIKITKEKRGLILSNYEAVYFYEVLYDGCEYLATKTRDGYYVLSHKGNCSNLIHQND